MASAISPLVLTPHHLEPPRRSPRTSLILAELTRQRRWERHQRRQARARWLRWLSLVDRRPFESVCTQATPSLLFAGAVPFVWSPNPADCGGIKPPHSHRLPPS